MNILQLKFLLRQLPRLPLCIIMVYYATEYFNSTPQVRDLAMRDYISQAWCKYSAVSTSLLKNHTNFTCVYSQLHDREFYI